jgi:hypothetical protein
MAILNENGQLYVFDLGAEVKRGRMAEYVKKEELKHILRKLGGVADGPVIKETLIEMIRERL